MDKPRSSRRRAQESISLPKPGRYSSAVLEDMDKGKADDETVRSLETEFAVKRAEWQRNREKFRLLRLLSFSFLSLVIIGGLIAFSIIFTRVNEIRDERHALSPSPTVSPQSLRPR
jgi:hypothetical protein